MAEKDVTGVICLPLPALNRGRHTLNCIYRDGKYNVKNRCFEIQVVSSTVTIDTVSGEGRPNTTCHFAVRVVNERGEPVKDGQVKMYYNSQQDNAWATEAKNTQGVDVELDSANIVTDGTVTLDYHIPNNFRAGIVKLRFRYDLSHEGYDPISIVVPVYVYRDGYIELEYGYGDNADNITPAPEKNIPEGKKCFITATVYDGATTDSNKVPISGVPINFKLGHLDTTNPGTIGNCTTNNNGQCTVSTPALTENEEGQWKVTVKNQSTRIIGETVMTDTISIPRHPFVMDLNFITTKTGGLEGVILFTSDPGIDPELHDFNETYSLDRANSSNFDETNNKFVGTNLRPIYAANCVLKINGNAITPATRTNRYGVAEFNINSFDPDVFTINYDNSYPLEIVVGEKYSNYAYRQVFNSLSWNEDYDMYYELNYDKDGLYGGTV